MRHYVGIDLHRRRSVIFTMDCEGTRLGCKRIVNEPQALLEAVLEHSTDPEVVIEATYGWYWAVDLLQEQGLSVHLAHPAGNDWGKRRVKNDERDARDLADLLRLGRLDEAWIAPKETRELRELVRYRHKLVELRTGLKAQIHAVMAKEGELPSRGWMFGPGGNAQLDAMEHVGDGYGIRMASLRELIDHYDAEVAKVEREIHHRLKGDPAYEAVQTIPGVGRTLAAIFVAEIGDVSRFKSPEALSSWAGLAPRHHESDTKVIRGQITKMGSKLMRWAAIEAVSGRRGGTKLREDFHQIAERRGKYKARAAVARKLLTLVYYGLRDHEIRALATEAS
ncbi:MAG TPA: IS110 family transposase [Acidimicrobiales bacterium]|nr:IS110 family transposase [Acidimicrobiales bacterium]